MISSPLIPTSIKAVTQVILVWCLPQGPIRTVNIPRRCISAVAVATQTRAPDRGLDAAEVFFSSAAVDPRSAAGPPRADVGQGERRHGKRNLGGHRNFPMRHRVGGRCSSSRTCRSHPGQWTFPDERQKLGRRKIVEGYVGLDGGGWKEAE